MGNFILHKETTITTMQAITKPIQYALDMFTKDMKKVFGNTPTVNPNHNSSSSIILELDEQLQDGRPESFALQFIEQDQQVIMKITGTDELGLIYGLLHISKEYLNIDPFWYWADIPIDQKESITIPAVDYISPKPAVRFRGWFVNDEVCLIGWKKEYPPTKEIDSRHLPSQTVRGFSHPIHFTSLLLCRSFFI